MYIRFMQTNLEKRTNFRIFKHNKKETNMKINATNINRIHDVLITDIQRLLFKQYNEMKVRFNVTDEDYDTQNTLLYDEVYKCKTLNDVNELVISYQDLFDAYEDIGVCTLEGTMNYIFKLLR